MTEEKVTAPGIRRPDAQFDPREVTAKNVSGSTAGSGSGDFHVYRQERLRELSRIRKLEEEARNQKTVEGEKNRVNERVQRELSKSRTRAAKRKRKKERTSAAKAIKRARAAELSEAAEKSVEVEAAAGAMQTPERCNSRDEVTLSEQDGPGQEAGDVRDVAQGAGDVLGVEHSAEAATKASNRDTAEPAEDGGVHGDDAIDDVGKVGRGGDGKAMQSPSR